jgi:hypothetical protein
MALIITILFLSIFLIECQKTDPVKYPIGVFPDSIINLRDINSTYDDYNATVNQLYGAMQLVFSSNRKSLGGQFDLEQGLVSFAFDQMTGGFTLYSEMTRDEFIYKLIDAAVTPRNDFGPYRMYSSYDGYEYLILASENIVGDLDLMYFKNRPYYVNQLPNIEGPFKVKLLDTGFDDAYLSFDLKFDSAYFTSNIDGNFDIYLKERPENMDIGSWFNLDYSASQKTDSINSSSDDKCPMVYNKFMVFTSDRPGGFGGFDLYYSVFKNGNWNTPVNFGPKINTSANEYRPLIGYHTSFSNIFMIFSSDRTGGKGGYDLYFTGIDIPR